MLHTNQTLPLGVSRNSASVKEASPRAGTLHGLFWRAFLGAFGVLRCGRLDGWQALDVKGETAGAIDFSPRASQARCPDLTFQQF